MAHLNFNVATSSILWWATTYLSQPMQLYGFVDMILASVSLHIRMDGKG